MDALIKEKVTNLASTDDGIRLDALKTVLLSTENKVDWAYEMWDEMIARLDHENSYQRSIGIMVLCNLAKSDTENRLAGILERLLAHTRDEKFITSRQCLQNVWKLAAANPQAKGRVLEHLQKQFADCEGESHSNLIRLDIIQAMRQIYDLDGDTNLLERMKILVQTEKDGKNRKKYAAAIKDK